MSLKKIVSKSIALSLVGVSVAIPAMNSVSAMEHNEESKLTSRIQEEIDVDINNEFEPETRLGGGPSPSAGWVYYKTTSFTRTNAQLKSMLPKAEKALKAGERSRTAFEFSQYLGAQTGNVYGLMWAEFVNFLDFGVEPMRKNVDTIKTAIRKNKTVKVKAVVYRRPASGQKMVYLNGLY